MSDEFDNEAVEEDTPATTPEDEPVEPALDPDVETSGVLSATVKENYLSDDERKVQEQHEALAEDLAPGETLPWVAPTPSAVQPQEIVATDPAEHTDEEPSTDE